jgi:hypothetical protein
VSDWVLALLGYAVCGVVAAVSGQYWSYLGVEPYSDQPRFLGYLTIVFSWPVFLVVVFINWVDKGPKY